AVRTGPRLTGTRTFTYDIVPHRAGTFALPPVRLVVYDVAARQFRTVHADPGALTVAPGDGESAPATGPPEASRSPSFKARPLLLMLGGLLVLVAGGLLWTRIRRQAASPASPVRAQPPKPTTAPRPASGLDAAEAALGVGDARRAATLAAHWLDEVLSRRLGRDLRRMSPEERDAALTSLPHAVRLRDLRFRLDAARFAPVPPDGEALRRDLEMLRTIVNEVGSGGVRRQGQA
ncbi:MAG TPA: hypothetical protein VD948_09610, partial [Rhodothermales bacterium]|nr:hypothetical protein [Rhodothermales bacterium]